MENYNNNQNNQNYQNNQNNQNNLECVICLQYPTDPIVTQCGHMYCWQCIRQWLSNKSEMTCAVCKNGVDLNNVIPLFGGSINNKSNDDM